MSNSRKSISLDNETEEILSKIPDKRVSLYVRESIKLRNNENILTDPIIIYKELKSKRVTIPEFLLWFNRIKEIKDRNT